MEPILFYIFAAIATVSAMVAITRSNPLSTALWLVVCFLAIAGVFGLLNAPIVALFQVLLAAGAMMVLFVFVVMFVDLGGASPKRIDIKVSKIIGVFAVVYFVAVSAFSLMRSQAGFLPEATPEYLSVINIGRLLTSEFAIPFELISVALVVAMVTVVVMGRNRA